MWMSITFSTELTSHSRSNAINYQHGKFDSLRIKMSKSNNRVINSTLNHERKCFRISVIWKK